MNNGQRRDMVTWLGIGLIVVAAIALVALIWIGWSAIRPDRTAQATLPPEPTSAPAQPAATPLPQGPLPTPQVIEASPPPTEPAPPTEAPTDEPAQPDPTAEPTEAPAAAASAVVGQDVTTFRSGPGTSYTALGYLDPGTEGEITGYYGSWWQVVMNGQTGWVYGPLVTASNTENVPEVAPPPVPTRSAPAATPIPPTSTPAPTAAPTPDFRGLIPTAYWVEGAPGPYGINQAIWFNWRITNTNSGSFPYNALGTWVAETGQFQKSWAVANSVPSEWRDHIDIPAAGTYHLYLRICFNDGYCVNLAGPIQVVVQ